MIHPRPIPGLTNDIAGASRRLAFLVRSTYRTGTKMRYATYVGRDGLSMRGDLAGLNLSDVPKVFLEAGNMRNASDARLLRDPAFRQREANALARAITAFVRSSS